MLRKKEKMLVTSKLLLFPQSFLPFQKTSCHFHQIKISHLRTLSVWKSLKFIVWERLTLPHNPHFNPLPNDEILDSSKLKGFADDNFKFNENGRKLF